MIGIWRKFYTLVYILSCIFVSFLLVWCWESWTSGDSLNIYWFELVYNSNTKFERLWLKTDDLDEITDLYQEVWNNTEYRDSLLVAKKYAQWLWVNAFAQDNLDTLEKQWLTLSDVKKTQIWLNNHWEKINAVLVEYEIVEWLIDELPLLYVSQLFIPKDNEMVLMSYITESKSSHSNALNMFKNIK